METPRKDDQRHYTAPQGDLSQAQKSIQATANKHDLETKIFTGFTDAMMGRYAKQLEADGKKQALIDAYETTKKGEQHKPGGTEFTKYGQGYEAMSKKIYLNQLTMEADKITTKYAMEYKDDPAGFTEQMALYMQKTEESVPEEYREGWHQELMGNAAMASKRIEAEHLRKVTEQYAASFVNDARRLEHAAMNAADVKNAALMDKYITEYEASIDEAVVNDVMTPAKGEALKEGFKAGVGEEFIMSHFTDYLEADLPGAIVVQKEFAKSQSGDRSGGSRSWRNRNPGNHRYGDFAKRHGATGEDKDGFAIYPSEAAGRAAQVALLRGGSYKNKNMKAMIEDYAPRSDNNNTVAYVNSLVAKTGIDPAKKMGDYSQDEMGNLILAMQTHEGWKPGKTEEPWEYTTEERDVVAAKMARMISSKQAGIKSGKSAMKNGNNYALKEGQKILEDGGEPSNKMDLDLLTADDATYSNVRNYKKAKELQPAVATFNQMDLLRQEEEIRRISNKPERNEADQYLLNAYEKSYERNRNDIKADPVKYYATKRSPGTFKPLDRNDVGGSLKKREVIATGIQDDFSRDKTYYTDQEATEYANMYKGGNGDFSGMIAYTREVVAALGDDARFVFDQLNEKEAHSLAMIGDLEQRSILNGSDLVSNGLATEVAIGTELIYGENKIPGILPRQVTGNFYKSVGNVFAGIGAGDEKAYREGVNAIVASRIKEQGLVGELGIDDQVAKITQEATEELLGGALFNIQGQDILPPWRDATRDDFQTKVQTLDESVFEVLSDEWAQTLKTEMAKDVDNPWYNFGEKANINYRSLGNGRYMVVTNKDKPIPKKDGKPFTIILTK